MRWNLKLLKLAFVLHPQKRLTLWLYIEESLVVYAYKRYAYRNKDRMQNISAINPNQHNIKQLV